MSTNLTIFQKGLILLAIPLLFQLIFFGVLLKMEWEQEDVERMAVHTKKVIAQAETAYRYLLEASSHVRRLVITGEDPTATPTLHDALSKVSQEFQVLEGLLEDNRSQQVKVQEAAAEADRMRVWLREETGLLTAGRHEEAVGRVREGSGQILLDSVRRLLDDFLQEEMRLDQQRMQAVSVASERQNWLIGGGAALSLVLAVIVAVLFAREVGGRLQQLADNVRRLGEKKELTQPLAGSDEIARLDGVFRAMARALREREQENEMFIYSVSHDLRSPLVNLQGFSEELGFSCKALRAALVAGGPADGAAQALKIAKTDIPDSLRFIKTAVVRVSGIIDALLRLSRVGRVVYQMQTVDVDETVRRVVDALAGTIESRSAEVVVGALAPALSDPTAVEQVFANLIGNAINYLDPARPGRVEVGMLPPETGGALGILQTYFVKDNGLGIPEAYQPRVFQAFQRLHADVAQGEGIGLALTYRMVGRLGGKIWLESAAGVGSTFFVALPPAPPSGKTAGEAPAGIAAPSLEDGRLTP
jgi:signal transduction histidine kinase